MLLVSAFLGYVSISGALKFNGTNPKIHSLVSKNTNLKICNGDAANFNDYPYMVSLYNNVGSCFCSGSILRKSNGDGVGVILTAAHCLGPSMRNGGVCVGCTRWEWPHDDPGAVMYDVDFYAIHPEYSTRTFAFDVALIYLSLPIIDPIGITSVEVEVCSSGVPPSGAALRIQGYGETESPQSPQLMVGQVNFMGLDECQAAYVAGGYPASWILGSMQCMTNMGCCAAPSTDCYGDSGSPILPSESSHNAIGVVSWGVSTGGGGCCPTNMPSVITDLCYPSIQSWLAAA